MNGHLRCEILQKQKHRQTLAHHSGRDIVALCAHAGGDDEFRPLGEIINNE